MSPSWIRSSLSPPIRQYELAFSRTHAVARRTSLSGGREHSAVGRHEQDPLALAELGGEPLEQRIGVGCVSHGKRSELRLLARAVEDDDAARTRLRDERRKRVDKLARVLERAAVQ